jgi:leader peptidase (prepilin peptidase)/N-methyltransferase
VELLTATGFALLARAEGIGFDFLRDAVFFSFLVPIVFIDIDHRIIPDELSLGGLATGLALSFLPGGAWRESLLGGVVGGGVLYGTALLYEKATGREGMGGGDVKLLGMVGAFLGWKGALLTIFFGSLLGVVGGVWAMRKGREGLKTAIPFGPYLCAAALAARYLGEGFWSLLFRI